MAFPLRDGWRSTAFPGRLRPDHHRYDEIVDAHGVAVTRGSSMYRDPDTGAMVMTATYLAERGYCCSAGCRHCPYIGAP